MDDLTLLRFFVAGDICLESNKNLRVEPTHHNQRQLFTRDGALLATAHDQALPPYIMLRLATKYTPVLHQALLDHHLVPVTGALPGGCSRYEYHPLPQGFVSRSEPARNLWKRWWQDRKRFAKPSADQSIRILVEGQWSAVETIVLNRGTLYITAGGYEAIHHGEDEIVWLEQEASEATVLVAAPSPPKAKARTPEQTTAVNSANPAEKTAASPKTFFYTLDSAAVSLDRDKMYIQTPFGEVVVMGEALQQLSEARAPRHQAPAHSSRVR
jgi:hypothetical protein